LAISYLLYDISADGSRISPELTKDDSLVEVHGNFSANQYTNLRSDVIDDCFQRSYIADIVLFESIPVWFFAIEEISRVLAPDHKSGDGRVLIFKAECARYDVQFMPIEGPEEFLSGSNPEVVCSLQMIDPLSDAVFVESSTETLFVEVVPSVVDDWLGAMIIKILRQLLKEC
jgi:hypothetical protein